MDKREVQRTMKASDRARAALAKRLKEYKKAQYHIDLMMADAMQWIADG